LSATELADAMERAFPRYMEHPTTTDKGCAAKTAIAKVLYALGRDARDVFLAGIRHRQFEAAWGKPVDTAAELRGVCALGLVRMGYRDVMVELADLLADEDPSARMAAARAIAYAGRDEGVLPLRVKALSGDVEPQVISECLSALIRLSPSKSIVFVEQFLDRQDESIREAALIALGESRQEAAFDLLRARWDHHFHISQRRPLLTAMALLRLPRSLEFLFDIVRAGHPGTAGGAIEALRIYRHDSALRVKLLEAVTASSDPELRKVFDRNFA
jgi:HEAT repeat protein